MSTFPTTEAIAQLGTALATDGFAPHEDAVADIVATAAEHLAPTASLAVLADTMAPDIVRARAFSVVAADLANHRLHPAEPAEDFDRSFQELLSAWVHHHDLHRHEASVDQLWVSRASLDEHRLSAARQRRQLASSAA